MFLTLLAPQGAPPGVQVWVKDAGTWKTGTVWIKVAGTWQTATPRIKIAGTWQ